LKPRFDQSERIHLLPSAFFLKKAATDSVFGGKITNQMFHLKVQRSGISKTPTVFQNFTYRITVSSTTNILAS
jgi:hypothetical protein